MPLNDTTKTCPKCGETKPATTEFSHDKRARDGLQSKCKACNAAYRDANRKRSNEYFRAHYAANKERVDKRNRAYYAANKEQMTAYREANKERRRQQRRAYRETHKKQESEQQRIYREANKEKTARIWHTWYIANRERVIARAHVARHIRRGRIHNAEGTHSAADIRAQYKRQKNLCYWCREQLIKPYHIDHVVPLSRGGSNWPENIVISCPACNLSKGNRLPHEWIAGGRLL